MNIDNVKIMNVTRFSKSNNRCFNCSKLIKVLQPYYENETGIYHQNHDHCTSTEERIDKMKVLFSSLIGLALLSGCAHAPLYFPTFGSATKTNCDMVWSTHIPASVANTYTQAKLLEKYADVLKANPSYIDKFFPSTGTIDALGRNGLDIGLGAASVVSAVQGNSLGAVIGSAVTAGLKTVTSLRSEDKSQDRLDACMPRDAKFMAIITEDAKVIISKEEKVDLSWIKDLKYTEEVTIINDKTTAS